MDGFRRWRAGLPNRCIDINGFPFCRIRETPNPLNLIQPNYAQAVNCHPRPHTHPHLTSVLASWTCILGVATLAIAGECLIARAMTSIGDLDDIRARSGLPGAIKAVLTHPIFLTGALCMALNFFAMLYTFSIVDLSLAAPAIGALTYIGNAIAAKLFLHENVDKRRWLAATFVAVGVVLISR